MAFKLSRTLVILLILPLLVGISCGLRPKQKEEPAEKEVTTAPTEELPFSATEVADNSTQFLDRLVNAEARARKDFASDAYLFSVETTLPATLNPQGAIEKFLFASPSRSDFIYQAEFSVSQNAVQRSYLYSRDFMKNQDLQKLASLNSVNIKEGYLKAVETAEKSGGKDFRSQNPLDGVVLTLKPGATIEAVKWVVSYPTKTETRSFEIDARTGEALTTTTETQETSTSPTVPAKLPQTQPSQPTGGFTTEASGR